MSDGIRALCLVGLFAGFNLALWLFIRFGGKYDDR